MKIPWFIFNLTLVGLLMCAGCATKARKTYTITGQIQVSEGGEIQKTGLAPIWVYDATNAQLVTRIPLPDFGGHNRADLSRIRAHYPGVLTVCSNYQATSEQAAAAEIKFRTINEKCWAGVNALHGQTNGPDYDEVQQLKAEATRASDARWRAWDESDDQKELIFYWFNVNPGLLYATLPPPLTVIRSDTNGNFHITLPKSKNVLLAAHLQGSLNAQSGHFFWLLPVSCSNNQADKLILNRDNVRAAKIESELKPVQLFVLDSGLFLGTPHRIRDTRQNYQPW